MLERLLFLHLAVNCFMTGYYYSDSKQDMTDKLVSLIGVFIALEIQIIIFLYEFIKLWILHINEKWRISFIWRIRNGDFLNWDEDRILELVKLKNKVLHKEKLKLSDKRLLYCINKIIKTIDADKLGREISKDEIKNLVVVRNPIILDIGTYDGKDAKELELVFNHPQIHCFEADPRSIEVFQLTNYSEYLMLHEFALSNVDGYINFYQSDSDTRRHDNGSNNWSASSSLKEPKEHLNLFPDVHFKNKIEVKSKRLDTWYNETLNGEEIDFIWADVNGGEKELIEGGLNTLTKKVRYLYIEFSEKELYDGSLTKEQILDILSPQFVEVATYNFKGSFGNVLLRNKIL